MANFPKGFVPDADQDFPEGFVPDDDADPELDAIGPSSFLDPKTFKPSPSRRPLANTGPIEDVRRQLDPRQIEHIPGEAAIRRLPDAFASPRAFADELSREMEVAAGPVNSFLDAASFGAYGGGLKALGTINQALGRTPPEIVTRTLEGIDQYRGEHPDLSAWTDMASVFTAPTQAVARGVESLIPGAGRQLTLPARAARATLASGGTGTVLGGAHAATSGKGIGEAAKDVADSTAVGLIGGAAVAAPLSAGSAAAQAVLGSKGGKARKFLEDRGVKVSAGSPGRGGPMDTMVTKGATDADIGAQAEVSAKRGLDMLNEERRAIQGGLGKRIGAISETPAAAQLEDVSEVMMNMRAAAEELDTSPQARAALKDLIAAVEAKQGAGFNPDVDNFMLSAADLNKLRRSLDRYAKTGQSIDASLSPLKSAAGEVRGMVNEGPFAEANQDYAANKRFYEESRGMLGVNKRPKTPEETQAAVNTVRNLITRSGQNTVTAGGQADRFGQFKERHPDIGLELERPEILRKRADIGFHLFPQHGGLIDRTAHPIAAMAAHAMLGGMTGVLPMLAYTNRNAIAARMLYGPALTTLAAEQAALGSLPQLTRPALIEDR